MKFVRGLSSRPCFLWLVLLGISNRLGKMPLSLAEFRNAVLLPYLLSLFHQVLTEQVVGVNNALRTVKSFLQAKKRSPAVVWASECTQ